MDKISGILPSTPRVTAVDLRDSSPVRSGTVGFGQTEASSAPTRRSSHSRDLPFPEEGAKSVGPMSKDQQQAELVKKMTDGFFMNKQRTDSNTQTPGPQAPGSQAPAASSPQATQGAVSVAAAPAAQESKAERLPEKPEEELEGGPTGFFKSAPAVDELYPKGSFLNTVA